MDRLASRMACTRWQLRRGPLYKGSKATGVHPEILNVKGFSGIRIHPANLASQLEGCIAPGKKSLPDMVLDSRNAYAEILEIINATAKTGEDIWIDIKKA
jgi:hypothetical protein